jgi:alkylated DNA repair dioxygenase AlkB
MFEPSLFEASMTGAMCEHEHAQFVVDSNEQILYYRHFLDAADADRYLAALLDAVPWRQETFSIYGKVMQMPRLTAWYGDAGATYVYSGIKNEPLGWTAELAEIRADLESFLGVRFNSVLLNRYRDGNDSISWHADDERELGEQPTIASISLGAARTFQLRGEVDKKPIGSILLEHGSLLTMEGRSQVDFQHAIPKERKVLGERINLTFRVIDVGRAPKENLQ